MAKDARGHGSEKRTDGTYDRRTGKSPTTGIMVARGQGQGKYLGVWTNPATGRQEIETSNRIREMTLAKSLGRQRNQIAAYDLTHDRSVPIGGSGNIPAHMEGVHNATRGRSLAGLRA
jgi:hypothetical protein